MAEPQKESWRDRLTTEQLELSVRVNRLMSFASSPLFAGLTESQQQLLREQLQHMLAYQHVLVRRIALQDNVHVE